MKTWILLAKSPRIPLKISLDPVLFHSPSLASLLLLKLRLPLTECALLKEMPSASSQQKNLA
jgi:hypothetical protein